MTRLSCRCLLVVSIVLLTSLVPSKSQRDNYHRTSGFFFRRHLGYKLSLTIAEATQMTLKVSDDFACVFSCIHERWCRSVNYKVTTSKGNDLHLCELVSSDAYNHSKMLVQDESFVYLSIKNPCEENPCQNGGICYSVEYNRDDYFCKCNSKDVGKQCQSFKSVRLVGSVNSYEGRVEVFYNGQWGTVCDDYWNTNDALVVCRQLGYKGVQSATDGPRFGKGTGPIWMDDVGCRGNELKLQDCGHKGWGKSDCGHEEDAGAICTP